MKKCVIFCFLFFMSGTTYTQSSIEIGPTMYLNRSDLFHFYVGGKSNSYYIGFNPYLRYSYTNKNAFVYSVDFSIYDLGTHFDVSVVPLNYLYKIKDPVETMRDQVIDFGFQVGYKVKDITNYFSFTPSFGINALFPNYWRANGTPNYIEDAKVLDDGIDRGNFNTVYYIIARNGTSDFAFGYTFLLKFEHKLNEFLSVTSGIEIKGSFTTLVRYELSYGFVKDIEDVPNMGGYPMQGALTNDNARYGVRVGLKYTFQ